MSISVCLVQTVKIKFQEFPRTTLYQPDPVLPLVFGSANHLKHVTVVLCFKFVVRVAWKLLVPNIKARDEKGTYQHWT